MSKVVGIIGGMGPLATLDLYNWIIKLTPSSKDQDHIPVVINSNPKIPDRTQFILGQGSDPRKELLQSARQLESMGADLLAMPCNTAHFFYDDIQSSLERSQIVNMIEEAKQYIESNSTNSIKPKIGLLATTGTIKTNLYQKYFKGYQFILPKPYEQEKLVQEAIYGQKGIKSGFLKYGRKLLRKAALLLEQRGAQIIVLGCTEVSVALRNEKNNNMVFVNPVKILAESLIRRSKS